MSRGLKAPFYQYEGRNYKDKHIRLTKDMLMSLAYLKLNNGSRILYNYMKLWACGEEEFEYSWSMAKKLKLFGSNTTYIKAKDQLIKSGFIKCIRTSKCSRQPNKYKFISDWQDK